MNKDNFIALSESMSLWKGQVADTKNIIIQDDDDDDWDTDADFVVSDSTPIN